MFRCYLNPNDKTVIVVGASPCLERDVKALKKATRRDFSIFCVNSALKYLLDHGVRPDYVVALDSDDHDIYAHLDVDSRNLKLIASNVLSPRVLDNWKGEIIFFPYFGMKKELRRPVRNRLGKTVPVGGNTFNTTVSMAINVFGARIVILVASECCYAKDYYVDKKIVRNNAKVTEFYVTDVDGNKRVTTTALHTYKLWLEMLAKHMAPNIKVIDTSFGILGKRDEHSFIYLYPLPEIIAKVKEAAEKKRRINADPVLLNAALRQQNAGREVSGGNGGTDVRAGDSTGRTGGGGVPEMCPTQDIDGHAEGTTT